jgi:hypothetical protein
VPQQLFIPSGNPNPNPAGTHPDYHRFAVSSDGQRFLISRPATGGANAGGGLDDQLAAVADGGNANVPTGNPNTVVINWPRMLEER